jgi:hypothetical protein
MAATELVPDLGERILYVRRNALNRGYGFDDRIC